MFSLKSIWKRRLTAVALAGITTLVFGLFGQPALAAAEHYTWKDTTNQSITATGGSFKVPATLTKSASLPDGGAEFSGSTQLTCSTGTVVTTLKLTVPGTDYNKVYPSLANLAIPPVAACANLDNPASVAKSDGTTTTTTDTAAAVAAGTANDGGCNQGGFTWIFCPMIDNLSSSINNLVKSALVPLLEVKPISATTTPELHQVWESVRNLTEILFIMVFLIIIYATVAEQDIAGFNKYTVKRMLPRLVAAAVLVQFSFGISSLIVDFGNVLGGGVESFVLSALNPVASAPSLTNVLGNMITGSLAVLVGAGAIAILATWTIALPLLLSLMISIFVVFLTLGARFLLIAILIAISPLAMLAWVLPNTENYFTQWRKLFLSLVLMYPIIVGVLAIAGIVSEILPFTAATANSGAATVAVAIIQPLIAIAAFLMVPVTFRWASKGLDRFTGFLKTAGDKSQGVLKGSEFWQRSADGRKARQADKMNQFVKSDAIKSLGAGRALSRGVARTATFAAGTAYLNAPKTQRGTEKLRSGIIASTAKTLGELEEATVPNMQKVWTAFYETDQVKRSKARRELQAEAPNLMSIASAPVGRVAVQKRLAEMGFSNDGTIKSLTAPRGNRMGVNSRPDLEYSDLLIAGSKEFGSKPSLFARISKANSAYELKDAAGNVINTISREVGDLDQNTHNSFIRGIRAETFGDKHHSDNFKTMGKRDDKKPADDLENRVAKEVAQGYAEEMEAAILEKAFSPNHRNFSNVAVRLEWIKDVQKNRDIFEATENGRRVYDAGVTHLAQDPKLAENMVRLAGADNAQIENLSVVEKEIVALKWYKNGDEFDESRSYLDDTTLAAGAPIYAVTALSSAAKEIVARDWYLHNKPYDSSRLYEDEAFKLAQSNHRPTP